MVRSYEADEADILDANWWGRALIGGIISLVLGLIATWVAGLVIPFPWEFGTALLAVGVASFASAFFTMSLGHPRVPNVERE